MRLCDRHRPDWARWTLLIGSVVSVVTFLVSAPAPSVAQNQASEPEAWRTSPFHGTINGATGLPIPCLCRHQGRDYKLGDKVCLQMPNGVMLARCDLVLNNTSWMPTNEQCTMSFLHQSRPAIQKKFGGEIRDSHLFPISDVT
jgi:hypothetical protein